MEYETSGYPATPDGVLPEIWRLGVAAGRSYKLKDSKTKEITQYIYLESIENLEEQLRNARIHLEVAKDPNVSISSANPNQIVTPVNNYWERQQIHSQLSQVVERLSSRRSFIYKYVLTRHYELSFSGIVDDVFLEFEKMLIP